MLTQDGNGGVLPTHDALASAGRGRDAAESREAPESPESPESPGSQESGASAEVPLWLQMPPDTDHSDSAELKRDVIDLVRELGLVDGLVGRSGSSGDEAAGGSRLCAAPVPQLDLRASTPYRLTVAARALWRATAAGRGGRGSAEVSESRDLLLLEVGAAGVAYPFRVAARLRITRAALSKLVGRAERDGLIRRRRRRDRRGVVLELTAEGRWAAAAAASAWRSADERLLKRLTAGERDELRRLLRKAMQALAVSGGAA